jgi:nucleotide-binding universal stress UspA family protein
MTFRNVLVAYNGGAGSAAALDFALWLAEQHEAHLTGILAHGASQFTQKIPAWLTKSLKSSLTDIMDDRIAELTRAFQTATEGRITPERLHWLDVREEPDQAVARFARLYDLTIVGQYENLPAADEYVLHPDRIAHASGRPILVAPKRFRPDGINESAVIAWDGKRSAARALFDAMHILETKRRVSIVTVGDPERYRPAKGLDLPELLARHGIEARHSIVPKSSGGTARTILDFCAAQDTGLLVMGAFEHSKLSEDLFGGVTSHILREAEIPVFVSH